MSGLAACLPFSARILSLFRMIVPLALATRLCLAEIPVESVMTTSSPEPRSSLELVGVTGTASGVRLRVCGGVDGALITDSRLRSPAGRDVSIPIDWMTAAIRGGCSAPIPRDEIVVAPGGGGPRCIVRTPTAMEFVLPSSDDDPNGTWELVLLGTFPEAKEIRWALETSPPEALLAGCPSGPVDHNTWSVSPSCVSATCTWTASWSPAPGAPAGTLYQVWISSLGDYCSTGPPNTVACSTTGTSCSFSTARNTAFWFNVHISGCPGQDPTAYTGADSFTTPPPTPQSFSGYVSAPNAVTLTATQSGTNGFPGMFLERSVNGGAFQWLTTVSSCPRGTPHSVGDFGLAPGTYAYRAVDYNQGSGYSGYTSTLMFTITGGGSHALTVVKDGTGTGTVSSSPAGIVCGADCSAVFAYGTSVTLIGVPVPGSTFTGWSGGGCAGNGTCTVLMNQARTVTATFSGPTSYPLTVSRAGQGSGSITSNPSGISCGATCSASFTSGTSVTLTAVPDPGSTFTGWSGGSCSGSGTCSVLMNQARTVTATFSGPTSYPLTVSRTGQGSGSVTSNPTGISCGGTCSAGFTAGATVVLTAKPDPGSTFTGWSGEGCSGNGTCTVAMSKSRSVTAAFCTAPTYTLTITKDGSGSGTVSSSPGGVSCGTTCASAFAAGNVVTVTAVPSSGSVFSGWKGEGCVSGLCIVTMSQARYVTATFSPCAPATPVITVTTPVTTGQPASAWVTDHAGSSYTWTLANGTVTSGQGTSAITFLATNPGNVGLSVIEASSCGSAIASHNEPVRAPAPVLTIASIVPASGSTAGCTDVTVRGTGFQAGMSLEFGGVGATSVVVVDGSTLRAVTPPHGAGAVDVSVVDPYRPEARLLNGFAYTSPIAPMSVQSVSPDHGPRTGGTRVTIRGTGFQQDASVMFDTPQYRATSVMVIDGNTIVATTPDHRIGSFGVLVSSGGQRATLVNGFQFTDVTTVFRDLSPASGHVGTLVTICGRGFSPTTQVRFNNVLANSVTVSQEGRTITCAAPQTSGFAVPVTVSGTSSDEGTHTFTYIPSGGEFGLTSVSPSAGPADGGAAVTITGAGFQPGASVYFDSGRATNVSVVDSSTLIATVPSVAAARGALALTTDEPQLTNVFVANPGSGVAGISGGYTYTSPGTGCVTAGGTLCLNGNRFALQVSWRNPYDGGSVGHGVAVPLTSDTGYFWFFGPENAELMVKVLDGRATNGYFWVFFGALSDVEYTLSVTDTATGAVKSYQNQPRQLGSVADTQAFHAGETRPEEIAATAEVPEKESPDPAIVESMYTAAATCGTGTCVPDDLSHCLNGGRFRVTVDWTNPYDGGRTGVGHAVQLSSDTGTFWFFADSNVELVVKVLDGRGANGRFWVFYGALSDVGYTITITDTQTGTVKSYTNPPRHLGSIADTSAF